MPKATRIRMEFADGRVWESENDMKFVRVDKDAPVIEPSPEPEPPDPPPPSQPDMRGWKREDQKLIDRTTGNELVLRGFGIYQLISTKRIDPKRFVQDLLERAMDRVPRSDDGVLIRTFATLPDSREQYDAGDFIHPRTNAWKKTRRDRLFQVCRDLGIWCQLSIFDEPDRTDRRQMPRQENSWFGQAQNESVARSLLREHYTADVSVNGGTPHVIMETGNEIEQRWLDETGATLIDDWLRNEGWKQRAISWGDQELQRESSTILCVHWYRSKFGGEKVEDTDRGWDNLLQFADELRKTTGNPVCISTDGKGLDTITEKQINRFAREAREAGLHFEAMLASWDKSKSPLYNWRPEHTTWVQAAAEGMNLR